MDEAGIPSAADLDIHLLERFTQLYSALSVHATVRCMQSLFLHVMLDKGCPRVVLSTSWRLQPRWRNRLCDALAAAGLDVQRVRRLHARPHCDIVVLFR